MKKLAVILCLGLMMSSMAACGNNDAGNGATDSQQSVESTESIGDATQESSEATGENAGVAEGEYAVSAEMQAVKDAIVAELGENYWPDTTITPDFLEGMYGITPDMYEDYLAENLMIATNVDMIMIIKPKADQFDTVKGIVETYQANLKADTMQYPMNIGKIQASAVEVIGDYVCFVQLGADVSTLIESGDEAVIEHCQAENEKVMAVLREKLAK
ncbi:MAG: DUF4358 domain-containing protein [Lachnospiraceae bacterium]|nr:DUF4358 domain-containing protein [Lachnospiraceae bacterium]